MNKKISILKDEAGRNIVILPEIIFRGRQNIDWKQVEKYLERYIGEVVQVVETHDLIHIGKSFPDEYKGSKYTKTLKGARAKARANAVQGIIEMIQTATDKVFRNNLKTKHTSDAKNGWYYYRIYFALPLYEGEDISTSYNIFSAQLLVNHSADGKKYLYDLQNIKKEASTPLKIT